MAFSIRMARVVRGLWFGKTSVEDDASRAFFEHGPRAVRAFPEILDQKLCRQIAHRDQTPPSPLQDWDARSANARHRERFFFTSQNATQTIRGLQHSSLEDEGHFIMYMGRWVVGLIGLGVGVAVGRSSKDSPTTRKMLRGAVRHTLSIGRSVQRAVHEAQEELSDIAAEAEAEEALATASKKASVSRKD